MSASPEPSSALSALSPMLPEIPNRLLRSRRLASTDDPFIATLTIPTSLTAFPAGIAGSVE